MVRPAASNNNNCRQVERAKWNEKDALQLLSVSAIAHYGTHQLTAYKICTTHFSRFAAVRRAGFPPARGRGERRNVCVLTY